MREKPRTLIRDADVSGRRVDVLVGAGVVLDVASSSGRRLIPSPIDEVVQAGGRTLLPGLHDHHLHLMALAATAHSVDCGPRAVTGQTGLAKALSGAPGSRRDWVRGTGYHESVAGLLDRQH